jgi:proteic killer suppression protein
MIKSFKHKGLSELFATEKTAKITKSLHTRIIERLDALDLAAKPSDMNVPGYDFHALSGFTPTMYSVHVNGPWCVTFEFDGTDVCRVNLEQYH